MFITPRDPIIICNYNHEIKYNDPSAPLVDEVGEMDDNDLRMVRDSGATTIMHQSFWHTAQPAIGGAIDWSIMDRKVEMTRALGMKSILTLPTSFPQENVPDTWWPKMVNGQAMRDYYSLWEPDATEAEAEFLQKAVNHFKSDDVQVILHELGGGEQKMHQSASYFGDSAVADFASKYGGVPETMPSSPQSVEWVRNGSVQHTTKMQDILRKQHNEVWTAWHLLFGMRSCAGLYVDELFDTFRNLWPEVDIFFIQYTYFGHVPWIEPRIDEHIRRGVKFIGEADHPRGLPRTTPYGIEHKWTGQICGPIHPAGGDNQHMTVEQVELIKNSIGQWYNHRGIQ
jgi:hypothetical protein